MVDRCRYTAADFAEALTPPMRACLAEWPQGHHHKSSRRALQIRGLIVPRGRTFLGDQVHRHIEGTANDRVS